MLSKTVLRQAFRTNLERDDQNSQDIDHAVRGLCARLASFLKNQSGLWAGFEPMGFEADIRPAIETSTQLKWAFPRVENDTLKFYAVGSRDELIQNAWKIWEPDPARATLVRPEELDGLLIPGLAFDTVGHRLGRGRGFYDRALAEISKARSLSTVGSVSSQNQNQTQPLKVGVALERQVSELELPHDAHDVAMDLVITEARTLARPQKNEKDLKGSAI